MTDSRGVASRGERAFPEALPSAVSYSGNRDSGARQVSDVVRRLAAVVAAALPEMERLKAEHDARVAMQTQAQASAFAAHYGAELAKNELALLGVAQSGLPQRVAVPKVSSHVVDSDFTEPIAKSIWCVLLECSRGTLRTRLQNGTYRAKPGTVKTAKLVALHIDGLPKELKAPHDRKRKVDEAGLSRKRTGRKP